MKFRLRTHFFAAPLVAALALSGCSDSTGLDDTIKIVRLTVGTQTAYFDTSGPRLCCDGAGDPTLPSRITIPSTGSTTARTMTTVATFHREDGTNIRLDPAVYELRLAPAATRITWTPLPYPSGTNLPFSGNLFRATAGITDVTFQVVEKASGNAVFGPHTFKVCTTNAPAPNIRDCAT